VQLCRSGLKVILACRSDSLGKRAEVELRTAGYNTEYRNCDIADSNSIDRFVADLSADYSNVHVLVNNAGSAHNDFELFVFVSCVKLATDSNSDRWIPHNTIQRTS
jgi:short-subunit dehydrogenase